MSNFSLKVPTWNNGCIEETVILKETSAVFKYTFSNSLDAIKTAIYARAGFNINLDKLKWNHNSKLSISVKKSMNIHNVNYSMTTDKRDELTYVYVNMRVGDKWYIASFIGKKGKFIDWFQNDRLNFLVDITNIFRKDLEDLCKHMLDDYLNSLLTPSDNGTAGSDAASGSGI
jgi:hypothetical protein